MKENLFFMDRRTASTFKGIIWGQLEWYLSHPGCDFDGVLLDIHASGEIERIFTYSGKADAGPGRYSTCKMNPTFIERLNVTNAFAQCRDRGIISKSEYYFVKDKLRGITQVWKKYRIPMFAVDVEYNRIMHTATEAMIPMLYPRQWAIVEETKEARAQYMRGYRAGRRPCKPDVNPPVKCPQCGIMVALSPIKCPSELSEENLALVQQGLRESAQGLAKSRGSFADLAEGYKEMAKEYKKDELHGT